MFKKATENIVENCGKKTLHAVTDLNSAERFKPLCIVEKKKSFWPFKKPSMSSTLVKITDLLKDCDQTTILNLVKKKEFTLLKQFEESPILNVSGHLGAKIAKECNVEFKGSDKMTLVLKLGDIEKNEVSWEKLREELEKNEINVSDEIYLNAKHTPRTTLCIVIESISTKDDGTVQEEKTLVVSADADVDIGKTALIPKVHAKGSIDKEVKRSFTIPSATVLAYSCVEFSVTSNGIVQLHAICDTLDDEPAPVAVNSVYNDVEDGPQSDVAKINAELNPLVNSDKFSELVDKFKLVLTDASDNEFRVMNILLNHADSYIGDGKSGEKSIPISTLRDWLGGELKLPWKNVLECLGFSVLKDTSIEFPTSDSNGTLHACMGLVDSIIDLSISARKMIPRMTADHIKVALNVVEDQLQNKDTSLQDGALQSMLVDDSAALQFLIQCGFLKSLDSTVLTYEDNDKSYLLDVYAVLRVFSFGK